MNHELDLQCIKVLSKTELRIFELLADGLQNSAIAEKLIVSVHTIKNHKANMFRKLELKNVHELYCVAIKYAIVLQRGGGKFFGKLVNLPIDFDTKRYLTLI